MCLKTLDRNKYIAKTPIVVYKELETYRNVAVHFFCTYKKYVNMPPVILNLLGKVSVGGPYEVDRGYHSYNKQEIGSNSIFIIPKGAEYYEGWYNDDMTVPNRVSSTIIFMGRIDTRKQRIITKLRVFLYMIFNR